MLTYCHFRRKVLFLLITLFYSMTLAYASGFPYGKTLSSESMQRMEKIDFLIREYQEAARKRFFIDLPPFKQKWDVEYRHKINKIDSLIKDSLRYPDVYYNILLFDKRIY